MLITSPRKPPTPKSYAISWATQPSRLKREAKVIGRVDGVRGDWSPNHLHFLQNDFV